ncbi:hypothetical protein GDO81_005357 [Engystomops pustulosus]|uniref:Uncharacterized protein n=1 Tax=Engystomops pustulosus TaxID=76066 RepID=A0AAV7CNS0_ENGPU|nr:hypothetical protein GDO81_005357 [Engystomops pustulosus]
MFPSPSTPPSLRLCPNPLSCPFSGTPVANCHSTLTVGAVYEGCSYIRLLAACYRPIQMQPQLQYADRRLPCECWRDNGPELNSGS